MEYVASQIQRNLIYHKLYPLSISFFINTTIVSINLWNGTLLISLLLIQIQLLFLLILPRTAKPAFVMSIQIQLLFLLIPLELLAHCANSYSNTTIVSINLFKMYHWLGTKYQFKYNSCFY